MAVTPSRFSKPAHFQTLATLHPAEPFGCALLPPAFAGHFRLRIGIKEKTLGRKKCKNCKGEGRLHVDPCPFGPSSTVLASEFECICGHPAGMTCPACGGTVKRQRHHDGVVVDEITAIKEEEE